MRIVNYSRSAYANLLCNERVIESFCAKLAALLQSDPYFFKGQLEYLLLLREVGDCHEYDASLVRILTYVERLLFSASDREVWEYTATHEEIDSLEEILLLVTHSKRVPWAYRLRWRVIVRLLVVIVIPKTTQVPAEMFFLKKHKIFAPSEIARVQNEILSGEQWRHCESVDTSSGQIHSIVLSESNKPALPYEAPVSIRESVAAVSSAQFPLAYTFVLDVAMNLGVNVRTIVISRVEPKSRTARRCENSMDTTTDRTYHVLIGGEVGCVVEVGNDETTVLPGELWSHPDNVLHCIYNKSTTPLVCVTFLGSAPGNHSL